MSVRCSLCFHNCTLEESETGSCRARKNSHGEILSLNYGRLTALALDPVEKKPLRHFYPGSMILSVGSFGCNMRCPFCQNHGISMGNDKCETVYISPEELSKKAARRIWEEVGVPTYLYEDSASAPHRKNLADVRRGGFEGLAEKTKKPEWKADFGDGFHESAGVTVTGARFFLVAYNFNLTTSDLSVAKDIAKKIRQSSGGLEGVKALGVMLDSEGISQVTVNLVDYRKTSLFTLTEEVRRLAREHGCEMRNAELIGLIPQRAMADAAAQYLGLWDFDPETRIIENYLL